MVKGSEYRSLETDNQLILSTGDWSTCLVYWPIQGTTCSRNM